MAENTLGRNQVFAIKNADGTPFHDLVLHKATYDSVVMSLGDKITGDVYYKDNRLNVTMNEYIEFKRDPDDSNEEPVKFVLVSPPTIIKEGIVSDNSELKGTTKYSFEFYHPMYKLGNMPLTDIAVTSSEENYLSQNKTFSWCGTGNDFIAKLNANLSYSEWVIVASTNAQSAERLAMMPSDVPTKKAGEQAKSDVLSFDKNTIADGLKTIYETWDIPFVVDTLHQGEYYDINGNDYYSIAGGSKRFVVVVGMPSNEIIDTESESGTVVEATSVTSNNIYYSPQPINVRKGKRIVLESLTQGATPIILNSSRNGVIGTTNKTFEADMTIYVGLYTKSGLVRYVYDGGNESIFVFRYGQEVGLKNNSRTPRNNKIITRISASGSEDNIPYGYPQIQWTGSDNDPRLKYPLYKGIVGGQYVTLIKHPFTRTRLMPTVYVESVNKKVNPNHPQYDPDIELVDYYDADNTYENPIVASSPSYEIHEFDGIKPELDSNRQIAIQGAIPLNDDLTPADSWVDDLKPDTDEYAQSFFRITLPPLGFDVYACASITQQMQINMRSGACIGCTFEIQVDWDDYKANFYDSDGNFDPAIGTGHPRDGQKYPNSTSASINVIVKKETATFGTLMPNIYQQPQSGDLFVILGISLPASYITEAQQRLDNTAKQYMRENNLHYFDYPLKFDEYFLAKHLSILRQIRTNTIVRFDYAGQILRLCVKQITIKFGEKALPQYNITLTDNIEVVLNPISQIANDVSRISTMAYQNAKQTGSGGSGNAQDKLSKVSDDTANGLITFLKGIKIGLQRLFGWDAEGNITANDISARTLDVERFNAEKFQAEEAQMNTVRSDNYNYDNGMNGTGFILTKWGTGDGVRSFMAIDDLMVRGKMTVNQLEIREETYTGGNQHWSPAGSVIFRVDYLDANGEPLGYQTVAAPWLLNGDAFFTSSAQIAYATRKQIRELIGDRINKVETFRCYIIANNGSTSTRNFWCIGDQARCQTYNIVTRDKRDGETTIGAIQSADPLENIPIDQKDGEKTMENVFYWRILTGVGTATLEDGKPYNYIDLPNKDVYENGVLVKKMFADGSDIPATGDTIVCFGNDRNRDRMGIVSIETYNGANESTSSIDETPAIKMYAGVNKFSTNGNRTGIISPGKIEFDTAVFRLVTHSGSKTPIANPRGAWVQNTAYFYYDVVQHNGSSWLCVVSDEYVWVEGDWTINDAFWQGISSKVVHPYSEGILNDGESGYQGSKGHEIGYSDHIWTLVQKYTTTEPSSSSPLWTLYASKGNDGTRGDFKSRVFCRTNDTPTTPTDEVTTIGAITYNTYINPVPPPSGSQGQYVWTDGIPTNSDAKIWSTVCTFHGGGGNSGWSTPSPESDTADSDLEFSPNTEKPNRPYGSDASQKDSTAYINQRQSQGWYDPSRLPSNQDMIWRAECKIKNGAYETDGQGNPAWVITKIKGEDGHLSPEDKHEIIAEIESELPSGVTVVFDPNVIIVDQTDVAEFDKTGGINRSKLTVYQNGELIGVNISNISCTGGTAGVYAGATGNLRPLTDATEVYISLDTITTKSGTQSSDYDYAYDNGKITFVLTIGHGTEAKSYALSIKWYLNRLGRRITETKGDIEKTTMSRTEYALMEQTDNLLLNTKNPQSGDGTGGTWQVGSGTSLSPITDSPVDGYDKAFRISSTSYYIGQPNSFWKKTDTYKFGAYVRCVSTTASATAQVQVRVLQSSSVRYNRAVTVGTSWTYVSFTVDIPQYNETTGTAIFQMGSDSGTVEFIAPILTLVNNTSVIRTDYMGEINSSAASLTQQYTTAISDATSGLVTQQAFGNYVQSATENMARLEKKIPDTNLLDCADGSGWMGYMGNTVTVDVSTQEVSGGKDYVSSAVYLKSGVDYVFSVYSSLQPAIYLGDCDGDPTRTGEDIEDNHGWDEKTVNLGSGTYMNCNRYYTTFRPSHDGYYKIELFNDSSFFFYRSQLEVGTTPTAWQAGAKNYSSEIKQTATAISMDVYTDIEGRLWNTGIHIDGDNRFIELKGDKVKFTNADGTVDDKISIDNNTGTLFAENAVFNDCLIKGSLLFHKVLMSELSISENGHPLFKMYSASDTEIALTNHSTRVAKITLLCDTFVLTGANRDYTIWLPPAEYFHGAQIEIINGTYSGGNGSPAVSNPSKITLSVFYPQYTTSDYQERFHEQDGSYVSNCIISGFPFKYQYFTGSGYTNSTFTGAFESNHAMLTEYNGNIETCGIVCGQASMNYKRIRLISTANTYLSTKTYYAWMIVEATE